MFLAAGAPGDLVRSVRAAFESRYAAPAAVVGRAPGRVNLIGEHTDYNGGLCLPLALPHATYAAMSPRTDDTVRISSDREAAPWQGELTALGPGAVTGWASYVAGVVWALQEAGHDVPGLDVHVQSTVPVGAGLSSSAALECSVAIALAGLLGLDVDGAGAQTVRRELVAACRRAETEVAGAPTGGMDQTVSLLAGPGQALLIDFDTPALDTLGVPLPLAEAGWALLVTDTRVSHALVDGGYAARRADCEAATAALGVDSLRHADVDAVAALADEQVRRRARHVVTETARVTECVEALGEQDWARVGRLFAASHASMRDDFEISCPELDVAVGVAVEAGASAARMTGGGFGGSSIAIVPEARVDAVVRAIDTAFVAAGFAPPAHLRAVPSAAAGLCWPV